MNIRLNLKENSTIFKGYANQYTFWGLVIAMSSIIIASFIVSYQLTGSVSINGFIKAQKTNPAIWILDLTPFMIIYWRQVFCHGLAPAPQSYLDDKTKEFIDISDKLEQQLKYESQNDNITNLPNSRFLREQINLAIQQLDKQGELAVIIIKIKKFPSIRYNLGAFNANNVLKKFAEKLKLILLDPYMLQTSYSINTVTRIKNDEFALFIPRVKSGLNIDELLSNLTHLITDNFVIDGININITPISGIAIYPRHGNKEEILLSHANIAVFHAEKEDKPYSMYYSGMDEGFTQNRNIMKELKRSIEDNELEIYYQPIVKLATGAIVGVESLARFEHPEYGLISAEKFIPLVEGTSLMHNLTAFMLQGVIAQLANWHKEGHHLFASVNLSAKDASNRELPSLIAKMLNTYKIPPELLKLELNERACLVDQAITIKVLEQLSHMGVKLIIDDFCSGFSSFSYLTNYPINEVKIEKSYVLNMTKDLKKAKIVEASIKLVQILGLEIIADGVADKDILQKLNELGCVYGQGFYFSQAVNANTFMELLNKISRK